MQRSLTVLVAALVAALSAEGANAQVQGVCVSGCNIPSPAPAAAIPEGPQLDPRLLVVGLSAYVKGEVWFVYPNGQRVRAGDKTPIAYGTKVETAADAKVQFLLLDETSFTIGPSSEMTIDRFVYDPQNTDVSLRVLKGNFRFISGKVARKEPKNIRVNIPVGNIGIRGTDFEVNIDPAGSGYAALSQGEIDLTEYDTQRVYTLRPGQRLRYENFKIIGVE